MGYDNGIGFGGGGGVTGVTGPTGAAGATGPTGATGAQGLRVPLAPRALPARAAPRVLWLYGRSYYDGCHGNEYRD